VPAWRGKVSAVFVVADPIPWGRDIQIVCDLGISPSLLFHIAEWNADPANPNTAQSTGQVLERSDTQEIPVYFSTPG